MPWVSAVVFNRIRVRTIIGNRPINRISTGRRTDAIIIAIAELLVVDEIRHQSVAPSVRSICVLPLAVAVNSVITGGVVSGAVVIR